MRTQSTDIKKFVGNVIFSNIKKEQNISRRCDGANQQPGDDGSRALSFELN